MKRYLCASAALVAASAAHVPPAQAGHGQYGFEPSGRTEPPAKETVELETVIVTASRLPAIVAQTPGGRVIDARTIRQRGAVFAADILADIPGLSVVRTGAFGGVAQVRMRGAVPGKTLVLVDGVPVNDPAEISGAFDFSGFELGDVERIEVLSGPQSSLWGSDAIGGVIAFTTREIDGLSAEGEAGSFGTLRGRLAAGTATDTWAFGAWISRFDTDGISAADEADGNPETDGFANTTIGSRGRYVFGRGLVLDGAARWSESRADIDGFPPPRFGLADTADTTASDQWSGFVRARFSRHGLDHQLSLSASEIGRDTVSSFPSSFEAERRLLRWQAETGEVLNGLTYAFGAEREETSARLSSGFSDRLGTTSLFGVGHWDPISRLNLVLALRWDDTDDFGSRTTARVSGAFQVAGGLMVSGAWGTGFKAPSISHSVCDFCFSVRPFPVLTPEAAESLEGAIGWRSPDQTVSARLTLYRLEVEDQITFVFDPATFESVYENVARTRTEGLEFEGQADLGSGFELSLAYAWTDAINSASGARLLRVPERSGSSTLAWTGERTSAAITLRAESDQADAGGVRKAFITANLNAGYALTPKLALTVRLENLADARYQQVLGYGEPGRSAYVGIKLRY